MGKGWALFANVAWRRTLLSDDDVMWFSRNSQFLFAFFFYECYVHIRRLRDLLYQRRDEKETIFQCCQPQWHRLKGLNIVGNQRRRRVLDSHACVVDVRPTKIWLPFNILLYDISEKMMLKYFAHAKLFQGFACSGEKNEKNRRSRQTLL